MESCYGTSHCGVFSMRASDVIAECMRLEEAEEEEEEEDGTLLMLMRELSVSVINIGGQNLASWIYLISFEHLSFIFLEKERR